MMPAKQGLMVIMTENDIIGAAANPLAHIVKAAQKVLPLRWAVELDAHGISVVALTPGFLRSESVLDHFAVTEHTWREAGRKDPNFLASESPLFVGRAVAALAADPRIQQRTGMLFSSWELARDYGFTDYDGRRPDWGRHPIDLAGLPGGGPASLQCRIGPRDLMAATSCCHKTAIWPTRLYCYAFRCASLG